MIIALVAASACVAFVKGFLIPKIGLEAKAHDIWALEIVVILAIVAAYIYKEILHGMGTLLRHEKSAEKSSGKNVGVDPKVLMVSLAASVAIYLAALAVIGNAIR